MKTSIPNLTILFTKFKEGDDDAFIFFYELYLNDLYSYGISLGCEKEVVKDLVQDIFIKIYNKQKDFFSVNHLKYFLFRSLKNQLYNFYKSKAVTSKTDISDDILNFSITTTVLDNIIDAEESIAIKKKIEDLLSKLTPRQKEVIYLRYMQNMEYDEISEIMGITPHATRKLVSRSLKKMRDEELLISFLFYMIIFS